MEKFLCKHSNLFYFLDPNSRNLLCFLCLNLAFAFVELFYGIWTNSLGRYLMIFIGSDFFSGYFLRQCFGFGKITFGFGKITKRFVPFLLHRFDNVTYQFCYSIIRSIFDTFPAPIGILNFIVVGSGSTCKNVTDPNPFTLL